LIYFLISGNQTLDHTDDLVGKTHEVLSEAEQLSKLTEGMLAAQRGYLLTGNEEFLQEYENKKVGVSDHIASLYALTSPQPAQQSRVQEIREYFTEFSTELEKRATRVSPQASASRLEGVEYIDGLRDNISRLNNIILETEYERLEGRVNNLGQQRDEYFQILLTSVAAGTLLLVLFNGFLLHAQSKRSKAEKSLKSSEERFMLAVDGTQDGVFDWDLETGSVFYSKPFFRMLGYESRSTVGKPDDFKDLVHPDDIDRIWKHVENYLDGQLSEYEQDFRMKHSSGRWVWIKSRAKAIYGKNNKPIRMVGAHTDITAQVKENEKLAFEKNKAEEQNQAKSEFLAHMSHEIRTPLNAITGVGEILMKQQDRFDDKQAQLIKTLNSSANGLKELITDILDFSKIENGEIELDERAFCLDTIFEETISMMALKANEKGVSFVFDYKAIKDEEFYGDAVRIRQILVNLVGNAIKFTDEGGVTVGCDFEDRDGQNFLRVDVSDTGIGIEPENFDLVFERFKQADSSVSRKYGGTGLGLPISKQLAKLMGGDIFLSSASGKGSTFSLLLPVKIVSGSSKPTKPSQSDKINQQILASLSERTKILIVEDYEGNIVVVSYIMEDLGFDYEVARNGLEAVGMWKENHYDLILMDVQMPEMDGFTATSLIRDQEREERLERTPIIGMTAHALVGDKNKCIAAGMDAYLPKPLVEADLKREMLKYLKNKKKAA
jgi:PAS domain S-box-containing protein